MATPAAVGIQLSEANLIRAGQRGDQQAVEALFRRYQRPLFQTALRVLGNTEDAEDALQDGLLSAYRNLKRFEGRSQFSTWLTRIVINAARSEEHTSELQSPCNLVCRLLLEKKNHVRLSVANQDSAPRIRQSPFRRRRLLPKYRPLTPFFVHDPYAAFPLRLVDSFPHYTAAL